MTEVYDVRTIGFIAGTVPVPITATVPSMMVGVIFHAKYALGGQTGTVTAYLAQRRAGTITGTLDVVTLTPNVPTYPLIGEGRLDSIVAVVDPGHEVVAFTSTGSVIGRILFGYAYGRTRQP